MPDWIVTLSHPDFNRRPGITPDLLTFEFDPKRSRAFSLRLIYRRWGISPRPENKRVNYNAIDYRLQRLYPYKLHTILVYASRISHYNVT